MVVKVKREIAAYYIHDFFRVMLASRQFNKDFSFIP
jgi:hypothetical protein